LGARRKKLLFDYPSEWVLEDHPTGPLATPWSGNWSKCGIIRNFRLKKILPSHQSLILNGFAAISVPKSDQLGDFTRKKQRKKPNWFVDLVEEIQSNMYTHTQTKETNNFCFMNFQRKINETARNTQSLKEKWNGREREVEEKKYQLETTIKNVNCYFVNRKLSKVL
jgi:hypothetical protein